MEKELKPLTAEENAKVDNLVSDLCNRPVPQKEVAPESKKKPESGSDEEKINNFLKAIG